MPDQTNIVLRTRDRELAHDVARQLAGLTRHVFAIQRYDARTFQVVPQAREVRTRDLNTFRALAANISRLEN